MWMFWLETWSVYRPDFASNDPTPPRGSIGFITIRWLSSVSDTTWAALAKAASVPAASPVCQSRQTLPGISLANSGAPAARAAAAVVTAGSVS